MNNAKKRILVIEDRLERRNYLTKDLEARGAVVDAPNLVNWADFVAEVKKLLTQERKYDATLLDIVLGGDDKGGLKLHEDLHKHLGRLDALGVIAVHSVAGWDNDIQEFIHKNGAIEGAIETIENRGQLLDDVWSRI